MFSIDSIPLEYRERAVKTADVLANLDDVLIAAHVHPDGDALGSMAAAGWMFRETGKRCLIYTPTGIPENLLFLDLPCPPCYSLENLPFRPKYALYLDCSEPGRLGEALGSDYDSLPSVNIDHHLGTGGMGSLANLVAHEAAATAQLVAYVVAARGIKLEGQLARAVGLGVMTDTGGFCHGNTTADIFELCANLARNGCDFAGMRENLQRTWTIGRMHLWGEIFSRATVELDDSVVICVVTQADLDRHNCGRNDVEGVVEWLRRLRKVRIAAILREDGNNLCKFSLRSFGNEDVRKIAAFLGGGGHRNAAGGTIMLAPEEAKKTLLDAIRQCSDR